MSPRTEEQLPRDFTAVSLGAQSVALAPTHFPCQKRVKFATQFSGGIVAKDEKFRGFGKSQKHTCKVEGGIEYKANFCSFRSVFGLFWVNFMVI